MIPIVRKCAVWAVALSQTAHLKVPILAVFGTCKTPCTEIGNCFTGVRTWTPVQVFYFKSSQNRCRINGRKSALYTLQKTKQVLASTPGEIFPKFFVWVLTVTPHLHSRFHLDPFRFKQTTEKPLHDPQSEWARHRSTALHRTWISLSKHVHSNKNSLQSNSRALARMAQY